MRIVVKLLFPTLLVLSGPLMSVEIKPIDRLLNPLNLIKTTLSATSEKALLERIFPPEDKRDPEKDVRDLLFRMEGLLRLYKDYPHKENREIFEDILKKIKAAEDAIGAYGELKETVEYAEAVGMKGPPLDYLKEKVQPKVLIDFLKDKEWIEEKKRGAFEKIADKLNAIDWEPYEKDRKFLLGETANYTRKVGQKVAKGEYDLNLVEEGIHEFRRNIRWPLVDFGALNGVLAHKDQKCPVKELEKDTQDKSLTESPYAKNKGSELGDKSCYVTDCLYFGLSRAVRDIGWVKEVGLASEFFTKAFEKTGFSNAKTRAIELALRHKKYQKLREAYPSAQGIFEMAQAIYDRVKQTAMLIRIADEIDSNTK